MSARWCGLEIFASHATPKKARNITNGNTHQEFSLYAIKISPSKTADSFMCVKSVVVVSSKKLIPQQDYYKDVNFNLEVEPMPDITSDSDDDAENPSE